MGELGFCSIHDIQVYLTEQLRSDIFVDQNVPLLLVRMLHNKWLYTFGASLRCYLSFWDTITYSQVVSVFLLPLILYGLFARRWRRFLWLMQLVMPLFFLFNPLNLSLGEKIFWFRVYYVFLALVGFIKLVINFKSK